MYDDIGCFISISCEPVRSDWARGPVVLSEKIGPVIPGKFTWPSVHSTLKGKIVRQDISPNVDEDHSKHLIS